MKKLVLLALLALLVIPTMGARLRPRHGGAYQPGLTPPPSFIENLNFQQVATDGHAFCGGNMGPIGLPSSHVATSSDAMYVVYADNTAACSGTTRFRILKYSYVTGAWTNNTVATKFYNTRHDAPTVFLDGSGFIWVFYDGEDTAPSPSNGPLYKISSSAGDITSFGAEQTVPHLGSMTELTGGFTSDGVLHLFGQHQWASSGMSTFDLAYAKRSSSGTWTNRTLVKDNSDTTHNGFANGVQGDPGCFPYFHVFPGTTTIFGVFQRAADTTGCSDVTKDLYFIKSVDSGANWTDAAGGNSVSAATGIVQNGDDAVGLYSYPSGYKVDTQNTVAGFHATRLSTGAPVILSNRGTSIQFYKWNGAAWDAAVQIAGSFNSNGRTYGIAVTSTDKILVYAAPTGADVKEYVSTNGGSSWSSTTIRTKGSETFNLFPLAYYSSSLAGAERVIVTWTQLKSGDASSNVALMDRKQ